MWHWQSNDFQGDSQADQIAGEVFDYDLVSCMDKTVKSLDDELKSYSTLTAANGQICLTRDRKRT